MGITETESKTMNAEVKNILKIARTRGGGLRVTQDDGVWNIRDRKTQGGTLWITITPNAGGSVAYTMAIGGPSDMNHNATERQVRGEISDWVGV